MCSPFPDAEQPMDEPGLDFRLPSNSSLGAGNNKQPGASYETAPGLLQQIVGICLFCGKGCRQRANVLLCKVGSKLLAHTNSKIWGLVIKLFRAFFAINLSPESLSVLKRLFSSSRS